VTVDNFYEKPHVTLMLDNIGKLRKYVEKLKSLSPSNIDVIFGKDVPFDDFKKELDGISFSKLEERTETMYFGKPFSLPQDAEKYSIRFLEEPDLPEIDAFIAASTNEIFRKTSGFGIKKTLKKEIAKSLRMMPKKLASQNLKKTLKKNQRKIKRMLTKRIIKKKKDL